MAALHAKITSALSTSVADLEIRDALQTLDARGVQNTQETRRNLRVDIEKEIIDRNADIVNDFGLVAEQLKRTGDALSNLQQTCAALRKNINTARIETAPMLDEAGNLMSLAEQAQNKQRVLIDFNKHFLLSDHELDALTSTAYPMSDDFFQALVKAKRVQKDSEILLGSENQRLGLDILDQCSQSLDAAFLKLFRWTQQEFRSLDLEGSHLSFTMRRALRVLAERPTLFQECLDAFAEVRERALADAFYRALTGSGADREAQKPIEFSAHEPLRYVGDMLAWAHSTAVSERESLEVLFIAEGDEIASSIELGLEGEPWSRPDTGELFNGRKALGQLVDRNLSGVGQVLRQHVDNAIHTHGDPVLQYKIANLVVFYRNIFSKLLEGRDFMQTLDTLENAALTQFRKTMNIKYERAEHDVAVTQDGLQVPDFLKEALDELQALLKSYDTSTATADVNGERLSLLLREALDPWMAACERLALSLKPPEAECFSINCLLAAKVPFANFGFTQARVIEMDESILDYQKRLVDHQHAMFLEKSGVQSLVEALRALPPPKEHPGQILAHRAFSQLNMLAVREQLDNFLPSALMDAVADLQGLQSSTMSREISGQAAERFYEDYEQIEEAVVAASDLQVEQHIEDDDTPTLRDVFPRTADEIRILLS